MTAPHSDDDLAALRRYLDNPAHASGSGHVWGALTEANARALAALRSVVPRAAMDSTIGDRLTTIQSATNDPHVPPWTIGRTS